MLTRRQFLATTATAALAVAAATPRARAVNPKPFALNYVLASAMYGTMPLDIILPEAEKAGTHQIDLWCLPHGNQREQVDEIGEPAFADLLKRNRVTLACTTRYPLGALGLADEFQFAKRLGAKMIVTGAPKARNPAGDEAKLAVRAFLESLKPHADAAAQAGVTIALENHANSVLHTPDSINYFAELNTSPQLGLAFAPHHLHEWADQMPTLVERLGKQLVFFYAQEHGAGFLTKLPKDEEMKQMPGFGGGLDYRPVLAALKKIDFRGPVEVLMHPTPRGIPILPTAPEITAAITKSHRHLDAIVHELNA